MHRIRVAWAAGILVAVICATSGAGAVDLPPRKPGLWEVTMHMSTSSRPPMTMKFCTDAATDTALYKEGMNAGSEMCSRHDVQRSGSVVTIESECTMGERKMTSHTVMTFAGDVAYTTNIQSHFDPPMGGRTDSTTTQEAKWTGACPADLQPGQMIAPNGMKLNLRPGQ